MTLNAYKVTIFSKSTLQHPSIYVESAESHKEAIDKAITEHRRDWGINIGINEKLTKAEIIR